MIVGLREVLLFPSKCPRSLTVSCIRNILLCVVIETWFHGNSSTFRRSTYTLAYTIELYLACTNVSSFVLVRFAVMSLGKACTHFFLSSLPSPDIVTKSLDQATIFNIEECGRVATWRNHDPITILHAQIITEECLTDLNHVMLVVRLSI